MSFESKTTAAVLAGYLLGRTEDVELATTAGDLILRLNISTAPSDLAEELQKLADAGEQLSEMSEDASDQLFEAVGNADVQALAERFTQAEDAEDEEAEDEEAGDDEEAEDEEDAGEEDEEAEDEEAEEEEAETRSRRPRRKKASGGEKSSKK